MQAWENSSPKGQIRPVLATIFNSDLFRRARRIVAEGERLRLNLSSAPSVRCGRPILTERLRPTRTAGR